MLNTLELWTLSINMRKLFGNSRINFHKLLLVIVVFFFLFNIRDKLLKYLFLISFLLFYIVAGIIHWACYEIQPELVNNIYKDVCIISECLRFSEWVDLFFFLFDKISFQMSRTIALTPNALFSNWKKWNQHELWLPTSDFQAMMFVNQPRYIQMQHNQ